MFSDLENFFMNLVIKACGSAAQGCSCSECSGKPGRSACHPRAPDNTVHAHASQSSLAVLDWQATSLPILFNSDTGAASSHSSRFRHLQCLPHKINTMPKT